MQRYKKCSSNRILISSICWILQASDTISAVSNLFDKHVFHWLRMTLEHFEQDKVRRSCPYSFIGLC